MRKHMLLLLLCACLLWLSGCGSPLQPPEAGGSVAFTDALGRQVTVPAQPQRVAALLGSFADVWVLAGGSLCAAAEDAWDDFGLPQGSAISLGGAHSPNLELLLSANPQLVLASASTAGHVDMRQTLEAAGIPVAYFDVDCFSDYLEMLRTCTEITGRSDLYRQNGLALAQQIEAVKAQYRAAELPQQQRTVLLLRTSSTTVKAKGSRGTVLGEMLADMGLENIADSDETLLENLSVEAVIRAQPQHIFVVPMGSNEEAAWNALERLLEENPAWGTLEAVQQGRLHRMEKKLFNLKPNAQWAEAYRRLYETLVGG